VKSRLSRSLVLYVALALVVLLVGALWLRGGSSPKKLSLDEFQSHIAHGDVTEAARARRGTR